MECREQYDEILDKWQPPEHGIIKLNCDGAFGKELRDAGFGVIVRNADGKLVGCWGGSLKGFYAKAIKVVAVLEGLKFTYRKKWRKVVVETDYELVFQEVMNGKKAGRWQHAPIISDIRSMRSNFDLVTLQSIRRNVNKYVGCVAHWYKGRCDPRNWVEGVPTSLSILLEVDIAEMCTNNGVNGFVLNEIM